MCDSCGCHTPEATAHAGANIRSKLFDVHESLMAANQKQADDNRNHIEARGAVAINLISSPGSGKTTLLERTIEQLGGTVRIGVIEGDIETERDADRIRAKGVPVIQLTTGGACHLDAPMVHRGLHALEHEAGGSDLDLIFIENVGNLVCPATFDLGEHHRVVLVSVPEGPDKPAKYPAAFIGSQLFLITKTDTLPYFNFPVEEATREALEINPALSVIALSSVTGEGFSDWLSFLRAVLEKRPVRSP